MVEDGSIPVFIFLILLICNGASGKSPVKKVDDNSRHCVCSPPCPINEQPGCRKPCPPETCITLYAAFDCVANQTCVRGCFCKPGYLRTTANGTCVPRDQCPPLECVNDPNAKKGCGNRCGKTCADYKDKHLDCHVHPCKKNGCDCKDGYIYDKNEDRCVKPSECTKQCTKPHERYSSCLLGECGPKTCGDLGKPLACPSVAEPCAGGCICEKGYVRDSEGNCIDAKTCPPRECPKNERPGCREPCPPETCITLYAAFDCVANQTCVRGCFCKPGYLRTTANGTCIPRDQCPPLECVNDPNAKKGCGNRCGKTCADYKDKHLDCHVHPCKKNGCDCKDGYIYDKNEDRCVKPSECTKQCTKPHERYSSCLLGECGPKTCGDLGKPLACPSVAEPCAGGCICEKGYVRDSKGNCIDAKTCPPRECPKNKRPGCRNPCPPDTCMTLYAAFRCIENQTCVEGCFCKPGYLRTTTNGTCIPRDQCPPLECVNDPNAKKGCGNRCGKTCADYKDKHLDCPVRPCKKNGCDCKDGYIYDKNEDRCVKPSECTKQCTKPHERYSSCLLGECGPKTCRDLGKPLACPSVAEPCAGGCICEEGYVRDSEGNCIDAKTCRSTLATTTIMNGTDNSGVPVSKPVPRRCPPNEVLKSMVSCPPDTCDSLYLSFLCIADQVPSVVCTCKDGYLRTNSSGVCVPTDRCLPPECSDDPNAQRGCGNRCKKTCSDYEANKVCKNNGCKVFGCDCKDGLVYDENINKCVKPAQCTKQCKKPHERYTSCLLGECVPKTCDDLGKPIPCPSIASPCAGGCICEEGYVRDYNGNCIDKKTCPTCNGDPNAESGCGNPCGKTCASLSANKSNLFCPLYCETNGCDCKKGYLLNTDTKKCVLERNCPKPPLKCGLNEECYCGTSCPEPSCSKPHPPTCINKKCKVACFCKKGYVRDDNNKCIPVQKCPPRCNGPHERYISCPAGQCTPKTCDNLVNPAPCPRIIPPCPGGCICEEGYLRNSKGICIEKKHCPQLACNANQTYVSCNVNCSDKRCPEDDQPQPVCDAPIDCPPGCSCKINYRLNKYGKCILASECPAINCTRQNEEYNSCPSDCLGENCEDADTPPAVCNTLLLNCQPKCICKKGYYRNEDGLCIPAKECPSVCKDPNAQWKDCKDPCPGTCKNTKPGCLSKKCTAGCQCNDGYVLSKPGGECVKIEDCPDYVDCGANQTFVPCTYRCPQVLCPESDQTLLCKPPRDCPGGCGCKPNYRYNADGECILASDCPPVECTRKYEEWAPCRPSYDWENCEDRYNSPPIVPDEYCNPRCVCKKGYYRINYNECVPESECPPIP